MAPGQKQLTISEIVKRDYRTADVFKKFGVNYCCGGNSTVEEVCNLQNINQNSLSDSLDSATKTLVIPPWLRFDEWSVDFLVDYIINVHHAYLKQMLPSLEVQLLSFVNNHRKKHPFLDDVNNTFNTLSSFLMEHTQDEEEKLFPYIKQIYSAYKKKEVYGRLFVKTMRKPLTQVQNSEHKHIAALLMELRKATNEYKFPEDACTNHQVVFRKLKELDNDLVQHKHLENNILFPKAIALEIELLQL